MKRALHIICFDVIVSHAQNQSLYYVHPLILASTPSRASISQTHEVCFLLDFHENSIDT